MEVPPLFVLWSVFLWWSLSTTFPRAHVGFPPQAYRDLALGATFLVLASLLIHELVVASVQKALGGPMPERIVLGPFGGGWKMPPGASTDPVVIRAEMLAGFCGPATYMVLASTCIIIGLVLQPHVPNFLPTRAVTDTVAIVNASLAVINLLPGAPLDAGRVLSAVVRRATGDPVRARQAARSGGIMIGVWVCVLGILGLATLGTIWTFWGVILGTALLEGFAVEGPDEEATRIAAHEGPAPEGSVQGSAGP